MMRSFSLVGLFVVAATAITAIGCDKGAKTDPAAAGSASAATTAAATTAAPGAASGAPGTPAVGGGVGATGAGAPGTPGAAQGTAAIVNGQKSVVASGDGGAAALNLNNERGSGSVKTDKDGNTTIKGKDGKTLNLPSSGGLPSGINR